MARAKGCGVLYRGRRAVVVDVLPAGLLIELERAKLKGTDRNRLLVPRTSRRLARDPHGAFGPLTSFLCTDPDRDCYYAREPGRTARARCPACGRDVRRLTGPYLIHVRGPAMTLEDEATGTILVAEPIGRQGADGAAVLLLLWADYHDLPVSNPDFLEVLP